MAKKKAEHWKSGTCRFCGCTDDMACWPPCSWADRDHTICTNPSCLKKAGCSHRWAHAL